MTSDARACAYANVELEGVKLTPEFKSIYEAFADNEISQLEAFQRLGIDIDQIPPEKQVELANMFMGNRHKHALEMLKE